MENCLRRPNGKNGNEDDRVVNDGEMIVKVTSLGVRLFEVVITVQQRRAMDALFLMEMLIKKMVISEDTALRSLVRNGERSGSRDAEERWCWRERVFEWAAFKHCLNKCSRAFTKSGYSSEARWRSAVSELEWTFNAAKASKNNLGEKRQPRNRDSIRAYVLHMMVHVIMWQQVNHQLLWGGKCYEAGLKQWGKRYGNYTTWFEDW